MQYISISLPQNPSFLVVPAFPLAIGFLFPRCFSEIFIRCRKFLLDWIRCIEDRSSFFAALRIRDVFLGVWIKIDRFVVDLRIDTVIDDPDPESADLWRFSDHRFSGERAESIDLCADVLPLLVAYLAKVVFGSKGGISDM
ncbi:hypothetical protein L484_003334 [Morus notabilis]|uniref:Uncharacterized protein n=1 Tax=Morus notabilis TaxID=981085 RepID=W9RQ11_9ROSA|nr:hypothetical protein L484_003334 [Morus notabilis]